MFLSSPLFTCTHENKLHHSPSYIYEAVLSFSKNRATFALNHVQRRQNSIGSAGVDRTVPRRAADQQPILSRSTVVPALFRILWQGRPRCMPIAGRPRGMPPRVMLLPKVRHRLRPNGVITPAAKSGRASSTIPCPAGELACRRRYR